jgi:hypothetical protein
MQTKILPIIFGINGSGLNGCINDAIIIYNLFKSFSTLNKNNWLQPSLFLNEQAQLNNIKETLQKNTFSKIIFFYSGHGYSRITDGNPVCRLAFSSAKNIYQFISNHINQDIDITFILDCCHSGSFPILTDIPKIKKTKVISACTANQSSTESLSEDCHNHFPFKKPIYTKSISYIIGLFTFNFVNIIRKKNISISDDFECILSDPIWKDISFIAKQTLTIKK